MNFVNGKRVATSRQNEIASLVEQFLDNNEEHISPYMFGLLDDLAAEIDNLEAVKENEKSELESRIEDLENELEELEQ
jgi:uncharacterized protein YceH (UPF0502 family)